MMIQTSRYAVFLAATLSMAASLHTPCANHRTGRG
jgi:hypothetical protein